MFSEVALQSFTTQRDPEIESSEPDLLDDPEIRSIVQGFVRESMPILLSDIEHAARHLDWTLVRRTAHKLKGSPAYLLSSSIPTLAAEVEREAMQTQHADTVIELVHKLRHIQSSL
jgi:HPt (histidine-containing phosphotransfer) domain-containing protein